MRLRSSRSRLAGIMSGAAAAALLVPVQAAAQQAEEQAAQPASGLGDIVVTAQRYDSLLQDTPMSIVAVDAETLAARGVDSLAGFDAFIPNVSIGGTAAQGSAIANFAIRGIGGAPLGAVTQESAVGIYVDDILFARPNGALLDLLDVERVEVLRGPQGTLFGRNTAGGAIRYITRQPSDQLEGNVRFVAGSRDRFDLSAVVNVPLGDIAAIRLSGSHRSQDGYVRRVIDDTYLGAINSTTFRGQLRLTPTSRLTIDLAANYISTRDNGSPTISNSYSPTDVFVSALYNSPVPGDPPPNPANFNSMRAIAPLSVSPSGYTNAASDFAFYTSQVTGRYEVYGGLNPDLNEFKSYGFSGVISYELTDDITIKSLTSYQDLAQIQNQDWDRLPIPILQFETDIDIDYYTQELQVAGSSFDDNLRWVLGGFYYKDNAVDAKRRFDANFGANSALRGDVGQGYVEIKDITTESLAFFGQGTFNITEDLSLTAGARWGRDSKDYTSLRDGRGQVCLANGVEVAAVGTPANCPVGSVATVTPRSVSNSWSNISPRFSLEYRWSPEIMTYVSAAKGFKGGGFNDTVQVRCFRSSLPDCGLSQYQPENLWTYEAGIRSDLLDRNLRLNITGFLTKYSNQQLLVLDSGPPPLQYTINSDSTVKGFEVEMLAAPTEGLILSANLGYVDASYDGVTNGISGPPAITPETPFFRSPKWSYSLGAQYEMAMPNDADLVFDLNYGWKASQASTTNPQNMVILPSYGLLNGRISYRAAAGWTLSLYGKNLTDEYYLTNGFDPSGPSSKPSPGLTGNRHDRVFGFNMLDLGAPRELGIELNFEF
jgi:iron complex outermembrane recepter protein